jgi:hypothetical protein
MQHAANHPFQAATTDCGRLATDDSGYSGHFEFAVTDSLT